MTSKQPEINSILSQSLIRYSQVWEDASILCEGLDIQSDDHVLSIGSAGCNAFALLIAGAKSVVAVDLNPAQIALIHLKKQSIQKHSLQEYRSLVGVSKEHNAVELYRSIRESLPKFAQIFWDSNLSLLEFGVIHVGKLDRYFSMFQEQFIKKMVPKEELEIFLQSTDLGEQETFFRTYFSHPKFVQAFKHYTGKEMIASSGRDPAQFAFVTQENTGDYFYDRFAYTCTKIPAKDNFYVHYLLDGNYKTLYPPQYNENHYTLLKSRIEDLEIRHEGIVDTIAAYPVGHFSKANLSDLFEYLSEEDTQSLLSLLVENMRSKGRLAYWNLLVPRSAQQNIPVTSLDEIASNLHNKDRCFFYSRFILEEIQ